MNLIVLVREFTYLLDVLQCKQVVKNASLVENAAIQFRE